MNPELPDLEPPSMARDMAAREAKQYSGILILLGILAPIFLIVLSVVSGLHLWLTMANLLCTYTGLAFVFLGWRRSDGRYVRWGGAGMLASCVCCLVVLSMLS